MSGARFERQGLLDHEQLAALVLTYANEKDRNARATLLMRIAESHQRLLSELERSRETCKRLNRRATQAEAACKATIEATKRQGLSLGRALANVGWNMAQDRITELETANSLLGALVNDLQRRGAP